MKFRCIVEYEYPVEHKPPVTAEIVLHGDRVVTKNITPLPKRHGRLIDADDLEHITVCSKTRDGKITRIDAPTIIEADKSEDLDNLDSMLEDLWNATESEE